MKIFLVGGAVRDKLLNLPCHERDWVVVGADDASMQRQGYRRVGADFPVYLHPDTQEEYALARTERKTRGGYTGFDFFSAPTVTLEEDLHRRDLTINAIAMDDEGHLIDPYGGESDLRAGLLRHVSEAFTEDPVRILRVARFAARFHHRGFRVANETLHLMRSMVENGEINHLVAERVWKEMERALGEANPEVFFETLRHCGALKVLLPEIEALFGVPQNPTYHPEVDCGVHTLLSLQEAVRLGGSTRVRFATLTHDLGKALTPAKILPAHHGHEEAGLPVLKALCERLRVPNDFRDLALLTMEFHTHCHRAFELKPSTVLKVLNRLDARRQRTRFEEFLLACKADKRGRSGFENRNYPEANYLFSAFELVQGVNTQDFLQQGYRGKALGDAIYAAQLKVLKEFCSAIKS